MYFINITNHTIVFNARASATPLRILRPSFFSLHHNNGNNTIFICNLYHFINIIISAVFYRPPCLAARFNGARECKRSESPVIIKWSWRYPYLLLLPQLDLLLPTSMWSYYILSVHDNWSKERRGRQGPNYLSPVTFAQSSYELLTDKGIQCMPIIIINRKSTKLRAKARPDMSLSSGCGL